MSKTPKAVHEGTLNIAEFKIRAYNLDSGERVLSRIDFLKALGRTGKAKGGRQFDRESTLPVFITANNLKPHISSELIEDSTPINFIDLLGNKSIGYKAKLLPSICYVFLDADDNGDIYKTQEHIVKRCKELVRGFSIVGIIALVDEATGYQDVRRRNELNEILQAYIAPELMSWTKRFPDDFYKEIFRLNNWPYNPRTVKRPGVIGTWTNTYIYKQLPTGVLKELKSQTPKNTKGKRVHQFHRLLTADVGNPHLEKQLVATMALLRAAPNWSIFKGMFARSFKTGQQQIDLEDE